MGVGLFGDHERGANRVCRLDAGAGRKVGYRDPGVLVRPLDETFDIGMNTRTSVDDNDYQVPFHFTGKIAKLTFKLGPEQLTEAYRKVMHQYVIRGKD